MASTQGTTLEKLLQTKGPLPVLQVAQLASRLVKELETEAAVAPSRRAPVLRSDRVLIGPDGKVKVRPYEADGISLPVIAEFPTHASPEEIRGEDGDFRSSLYSLGCTLFQVLTGHLPFGDPRQGLVSAVWRDKLRHSGVLAGPALATLHEGACVYYTGSPGSSNLLP